MSNKYYIPNITQFVAGFEYEVKEDIEYQIGYIGSDKPLSEIQKGFEWRSRCVIPNVLPMANNLSINQIMELIKNGRIRAVREGSINEQYKLKPLKIIRITKDINDILMDITGGLKSKYHVDTEYSNGILDLWQGRKVEIID